MRRLVVLVALLGGCELAVSTNGLQGGCPAHLPGPPMVQIASPLGTYCIDSTETTIAQYEQFMASSAAPPAGAGCAQSAPKTPGNWPPQPGTDAFPVNNVTWCQAYAYCEWAGKRLCGQIGGGALAQASDTMASQSQWLYACSDGGARTYPYGNTYSVQACGGQQSAMPNPEPVDFYTSCVGGFPGLDDMSGNVWEWNDTCDSNDPGAFCHAVGGGFDSTPTELECLGERNWVRTSSAANIGFRCCLDL